MEPVIASTALPAIGTPGLGALRALAKSTSIVNVAIVATSGMHRGMLKMSVHCLLVVFLASHQLLIHSLVIGVELRNRFRCLALPALTAGATGLSRGAIVA